MFDDDVDKTDQRLGLKFWRRYRDACNNGVTIDLIVLNPMPQTVRVFLRRDWRGARLCGESRRSQSDSDWGGRRPNRYKIVRFLDQTRSIRVCRLAVRDHRDYRRAPYRIEAQGKKSPGALDFKQVRL